MPGRAVNGTTSITTARTLVLEENTRRQFAVFTNNSAGDISLLLGDQGANGAGIVLKGAGGLYEINSLNPWTGPVYAIAGATLTLAWTEVT